MKTLTCLVTMLLVCAASAHADAEASHETLNGVASIVTFIVVTAILFSSGMLLLLLWRSLEHDAAPGRFVPWGLPDLLLALGVYYLLLWVLMLAVHATVVEEYQTTMGAAVAGLGGLVLAALVFWHLANQYGLDRVEAGFDFGHWLCDLLLAAGLLLLVLAARMPMTAFFDWLSRTTGTPLAPQRVVEDIARARSPWLVGVLSAFALVAAPLWEEVIFRGFFQPAFRRYLGPTTALVLTAVIFAVIHDPGSAFMHIPVMIFPLALALGWAYHRTQRLAAPIFLHLLHNTLSVVWILYVAKPSP